jgi:AcrR family transcriptional regulator
MMPQATEVRERIVNAAGECFARYGVGKTTVEDIAAAAGVSRATVYRNFAGGRDEVVLAVVLRDLRRFLDRLAARLRLERSVPDAIVEGVVDAVTFVRGDPQLATLLAADAAGPMRAAVAGGARSLLELCADYVRPHFGAAQRQGSLRADITVEGSVEFLFRIISSMIVMPRDGEPREFLRTYVVPALAESS